MIASRTRKLSPAAPAAVTWSDGVVQLHDQDLFGNQPGDLCIVFLRRVFALAEIKWVEIDPDRSTAKIHYDPGPWVLADFLQRLRAAIQGRFPPDAVSFSEGSIAADLSQSVGRIRVRRFGTALTTWDIVNDQPGRIRFRHQAIRRDAMLATRISDVVASVAGVVKHRVSHVTGSVLIQFDPALTTAPRLLQILERARRRPAPPDLGPALPGPVSFGFANTSLLLTCAGEFAVPALLPACAALLVGANLDTFRTAGQQLRQGQLGLPALYSSIVAATLASGQFIAADLMNWMLRFWRYQYRRELVNVRRGLLGQITQQPCYIRLATRGPEAIDVEIPTEDLRSNDVILVSAGEQIPVDGRVLQGCGLVDERTIRGVEGLDRKQPDDTVLAGSTLLRGELHVEVHHHGAETQAALLARASLEAPVSRSGSPALKPRSETLAEWAVPPTMAMAGLGILVGGLTTAVAILRPDYATTSELALPLETLQAISLCIHHGIVIRDHDAIERLAATDLLVLDHHVLFERTELELDTVEVFPGHSEEDLLRYAAAAFHDLDDERAAALRGACLERRIKRLTIQPVEFATDITLIHGNDHIKVGDLGSRGSRSPVPRYTNAPCETDSEPPGSLMVGINGRVAGLIHFRHSARFKLASALQQLRSRRNLRVGIISEKPHATLTPLAASLGVDFHLGGQSRDDRVRFLQYCRGRGFKAAYIGDCRIDPRTVAEAHVAISLAGGGPGDIDRDPAPIRLLQPRFTKLTKLWDIAHVHQHRLKVAHGSALIPNLFCTAGAFALGFTPLASAVVTNLGTYSVYSRTASSIRNLERQICKPFHRRLSLARGSS
jgi:cation transport ATPase